MYHYEISFLIPQLSSEKRKELFSKIEEKIKKLNGQVEDSFIEKKTFAYPVKEYTEGFLASVAFSLEEPEKARKLENLSRLDENILRELLERKEAPSQVSSERETKKKGKEKAKLENLDEKLGEILE